MTHQYQLLDGTEEGSNTYREGSTVLNMQSEYEQDFEEYELEAPASLIFEMSQVNEPKLKHNEVIQPIKRKTKTNRKERLNNVSVPFMFNWNKVGNLDNYLKNVYAYFEGKGIYCIILNEILNLLSMIFVVFCLTFVGGCLDYDKFKPGNNLSDAIIKDCIYKLPILINFGLILFIIIIFGYLLRIIYYIRDLLEMYYFYTKVLGIPDEDMQSIDWKEIVKRISRLNPPKIYKRGSNIESKNFKLDAYRITHLIMRKDNYHITLYNQNILKLGIKLPSIFGKKFYPVELTRGLEYNIAYCIDSTFFDSRGKLISGIRRENESQNLASKLRQKFRLMGLINLLFGPIIISYMVIYFIFRYFEEYYKNPKSLGIRNYTLLAQWNFKELNELPHQFRNRLNLSYPIAVEYLEHFPKEKTAILMRFISLIAGTLAGLFAILAIFDSEVVLQFEIVAGRSVLACTAILGMVLAVTRAPPPDFTKMVNAESHLSMLLEHLHYMPKQWEDKLHSEKVRQAFSGLFTFRVTHLLNEIVGLIITPYILLFSLTDSCEDIVDLFKECTSHEEGLGYVCSLACFDLKKHGNIKLNIITPDNFNKKYVGNNGKLEKSIITFKKNNPEWLPHDPTNSIFLNKFKDINQNEDLNPMLQSNAMKESYISNSSHFDEPISSNPFERGMLMRALNLMIELQKDV